MRQYVIHLDPEGRVVQGMPNGVSPIFVGESGESLEDAYHRAVSAWRGYAVQGAGMIDPVNHPAHYHPSTIEVIDAAETWGLDRDAYLFNVVKYVVRAGKKDPARTLDDLKKAAWYLSRRIARMELEPTPSDTPS